jgi:large subunit ribosomal protein L25
VDGVGPSEVMFLDRQIDPVKTRLIHADLRRLVRGQEIEVSVRLELEGEPEGVREGEGVLEQLLREVEIRCRPGIIPDFITVDVSNLGAHEVLHVSDVRVDEGITILTDPETAVATVATIREEPVEEIAPAEEVAEPEVIGKGKKEDEE